MTAFLALMHVEEIRTALIVGSTVAVATSLVGVLTVLRGQSFAGHSLTDLASVGGSAAFLLGVGQLWGFLVADVLAALGMEAIGVDRIRGRDVSTGIVLGTGMGLTSLFLSLSTTTSSGGRAAMAVLFGSLFAIDRGTIPLVAILSAVCIIGLAVIWRPALMSTVSPDLARARGVRTETANVSFMLVLAMAVALGSISVGAVLSTALLIGPASCGLMIARRPSDAMVVSCLVGLVCVWAGIAVSYASYYWTAGRSWSVSFCIVALVLVCHLLFQGARGLVAAHDARIGTEGGD